MSRGRVPHRRVGSAKSTLLRCVNLLEPIDGALIWFGVEITAVGTNVTVSARNRDRVPVLQPLLHMSVLEKRDARAAQGSASRAGDRTRGDELAHQVRLVDKRDEYLVASLAGQQQRVAIVRRGDAAGLMLLDQVTSAPAPSCRGGAPGHRELVAQGMNDVIATHEMGFAVTSRNAPLRTRSDLSRYRRGHLRRAEPAST